MKRQSAFLWLTVLVLIGCRADESQTSDTEPEKSPFDLAKKVVREAAGDGGSFANIIHEATGTSDGTAISIYDGDYTIEGQTKNWRVVTNDNDDFVYGSRIGEKVTNVIEDPSLSKNIDRLLNSTPTSLAQKFIKSRIASDDVTFGKATQRRERLLDQSMAWVVEGSYDENGKITKWRVLTNPTYTFVYGSKIGEKLAFELENVDPQSKISLLLNEPY